MNRPAVKASCDGVGSFAMWPEWADEACYVHEMGDTYIYFSFCKRRGHLERCEAHNVFTLLFRLYVANGVTRYGIPDQWTRIRQ